MIYLNGVPLNVTLFPDNTSQVWKLNDKDLYEENYATIIWEFSNEAEFLHLAQLKDVLDKFEITANLEIKYLPYGRQDKKITNCTTFALHSFAKLLNSLRFNEIKILDPHSKVATKLIHNSIAVYPIKKVKKIYDLTHSNLVCYPDDGAYNKYSERYLTTESFIAGEKVREQSTGHIISYKINREEEIKDKNVLIVDDICDGGATFKLLTEKLLKAGAKEVNLFVTHGIFSKGIKPLKLAGINRIFTNKGEAFDYQGLVSYKEIK